MNEQRARIKKYIEEKINCNLEDLTKKIDKINELYRGKFSTNKIYGEFCFPKIVVGAYYKEKDAHWTLAEKCIRRKHDIPILKLYYKTSKKMLAEISNAEVFSDLIIRAIPLELLWAMEFEKEDDYVFDEDEDTIFNCLRIIANFYLEETQKYEDLLDKKVEKYNNKNKTKNKK